MSNQNQTDEAETLETPGFLLRPIREERQIDELVEGLESVGWLFHFDDDPFDIVWNCSPAPTDEQKDQILSRVGEALSYDETRTWDLVLTTLGNRSELYKTPAVQYPREGGETDTTIRAIVYSPIPEDCKRTAYGMPDLDLDCFYHIEDCGCGEGHRYFLILGNSEYTSDDLSELEPLLAEFMVSEGVELPLDMATKKEATR